MKKSASSLEIPWHFVDSFLSWKASAWERCFRILKSNMYKLMSDHKVCFDEALTILKCIQRNMNSSVNGPVSLKGKSNTENITPSDILYGRKMEQLTLYPEILDSSVVNDDYLIHQHKFLTDWINKITDEMGKTYLPLRNLRSKWKFEAPSYKEGDIVRVRPVHTRKKVNPLLLPKAKIMKVHQGRTGVARRYELDYGHDSKNAYKKRKKDRYDLRDHSELLPLYPRDYIQKGLQEALYNVYIRRPVNIISLSNYRFKLER